MTNGLTPEGKSMSAGLAMLVGAEDGECFSNAIYALHVSPEAGMSYVEGIAVSHGMILAHHGWLELPSGTIIDPTPSYHTRGQEEGDAVYYPVQRWSMEEIRSIFFSNHGDLEVTLPLLGNGDVLSSREFYNPEYRKAYRQAANDTFDAPFAEVFLRQLNKTFHSDS